MNEERSSGSGTPLGPLSRSAAGREPRSGDGAPAATDAVDALVALARPRRRMVALTGAGISTESGIPDYRGPGGVWERNAIPTLGGFRGDPAVRRAYWEGRRTRYTELLAAEPNAGHRALVALERAGRLQAIITQNIDGLHQKAGSDPKRVVELHGSSHRVRCLDCGRVWPAPAIQARLEAGESVPECVVCGGPLRGATVLFGESLPEGAIRLATAAAQACDLLLVVGTSLVVNPAAQLPVLAQGAGAVVAIVNRTPTLLDDVADLRVLGDAGPVLAALAAALTASDRGREAGEVVGR